ncbi:MAG: hypothetical protein AB7T06_13300 [Kofleriaceae bacterium]
MTVTRWAISLEKELAKQIKRSAAGEPLSGWLADAARRKLRSEGMLEVVADWEKEHGTITDAEADRVWADYQAALRAHRSRKKKRR